MRSSSYLAVCLVVVLCVACSDTTEPEERTELKVAALQPVVVGERWQTVDGTAATCTFQVKAEAIGPARTIEWLGGRTILRYTPPAFDGDTLVPPQPNFAAAQGSADVATTPIVLPWHLGQPTEIMPVRGTTSYVYRVTGSNRQDTASFDFECQ